MAKKISEQAMRIPRMKREVKRRLEPGGDVVPCYYCGLEVKVQECWLLMDQRGSCLPFHNVRCILNWHEREEEPPF